MRHSKALLSTSILLALASACPPQPPAPNEGEGEGEGDSGEGEGDFGEGEGEGDSGEGEGEGDVDVDVDAHTALDGSGVLHLTSALPVTVADCGAGDACDDLDDDGLVDAWEDVALERLRPVLRLDEDEDLVDDDEAVVGVVGRVSPVSLSPLEVRVWLMLGYSVDYGSCGGFTGHPGDSERVALTVARGDGEGDVVVSAAFTTGHEGTSNDQSRVFRGADLRRLQYVDDPATGEPRWVVFPSSNKHATYADLESCEDVSNIPCLDEDCGPDGVSDPARYDLLPPFVNAGEPDAPLVTALDVLGFAGDDAWLPQPFCGGHPRSDECASPVREKLVDDPLD